MSLRMIRTAARVEVMDQPHEARLLLLLLAARKRSGRALDGLTKLAKLDFLLRYPNCLERALGAAGKDPSMAGVLPHEKSNIETTMIRFRYGPWDSRYRRWLSLLVARGVAVVSVRGRTVWVCLTEAGVTVAGAIAGLEQFRDLAERSVLVARVFGDMSGTRLKGFIYDYFPELTNMRWGEEIVL